jgi:hypothetical protein
MRLIARQSWQLQHDAASIDTQLTSQPNLGARHVESLRKSVLTEAELNPQRAVAHKHLILGKRN